MPTDPQYLSRAAQMHKNAEATWAEWFHSLTPEEQAFATTHGLHQPSVDNPRVAGHGPDETGDAADSPRASVIHTYVEPEELNPATHTPAKPSEDPELEFLRRLAGKLISDHDTRTSVAALCFALEMAELNGLGTVESYAPVIGLTPQSLHTQVQAWQTELDLDPEALRLLTDDITVLQGIAGTIIQDRNVKISVAGLCFALNMDALNGESSIRDYVTTISVSVEAVSKKKRAWERRLGITAGAFSKTSTARAALSAAQQVKHYKKQTWKAHAHTSPAPSPLHKPTSIRMPS